MAPSFDKCLKKFTDSSSGTSTLATLSLTAVPVAAVSTSVLYLSKRKQQATRRASLGCHCGKVVLDTSQPDANYKYMETANLQCACHDCVNYCKAVMKEGKSPSSFQKQFFDHGVPTLLLYDSEIVIQQGKEHLESMKLSAKTENRRVFAACCGTPIAIAPDHQHLNLVYSNLVEPTPPKVCKDDEVPFPSSVIEQPTVLLHSENLKLDKRRQVESQHFITTMAKCIIASFYLLLPLLAKAAASPLSSGPWGPTHPLADPAAAVIVAGPFNTKVRFTVLTNRLIRVEQQDSGKGFEDRKTVAVINRNLTVPHFEYSVSGGVLFLKTDCLTLKYTTEQEFSSTSFQVSGKMHCNEDAAKTKNIASWTYHYGVDNPLNLLGTIRTLDGKGAVSLNCSQMKYPESDHCEWGLISRSGWAIVNDTSNYALSDDGDWWDGPNKDVLDIYIFGHGHDYMAALRDYRHIGGYIPLLPRYALGNWFSRWYDYSAESAAEVIRRYEDRCLPLDVFVLDMNWHTKNDWTGYSWDRRLWGEPCDALAYIKHRGLAVTLNLHDADGVNFWEDQYDNMCQVVGCNDGKRIEFSVVNETVLYALEDQVLQPLEGNGVNFWWIDWQQGEDSGGSAGGKQNPTIWTAHVRSTDANRRKSSATENSNRNMVLARWGGLGAHRYPVHFSGDVTGLSWDNLAYQPYFSMTATNVGAIWSHDIQGPSQEPELFTRWLQWGVVSGISRVHDRGMSAGTCVTSNTCSVVEAWNVPPIYAQANFEALQLRGKLIPYLYTAAYQAHTSGLWFTRPMYYYWPELEGAYGTATPRPDQNTRYNSAFMFGDDMWVAPVVQPANETDGIANIELWIPPGKWVSTNGGEILSGTRDGTSSRKWAADLSDIPMFARAGSIIPSIPVSPGRTIGLATKPFDNLVWTVYLANGGPMSGSGTVYEDDGTTTAYQTRESYRISTATFHTIKNNEFASKTKTNDGFEAETIQRRHASADTTTVDVFSFTVSTQGHCDNLPTTRATTLRIVNSPPPTTVVVNQEAYRYARFGGKGTWTYDSSDMAVVVETVDLPIDKSLEIVMQITKSTAPELSPDGMGFQIKRAIAAKAALDEIRLAVGKRTHYDQQANNLLLAASMGVSLESAVGQLSRTSFDGLLKSLPKHLEGAFQEVKCLGNSPSVLRALALVKSAMRNS